MKFHTDGGHALQHAADHAEVRNHDSDHESVGAICEEGGGRYAAEDSEQIGKHCAHGSFSQNGAPTVRSSDRWSGSKRTSGSFRSGPVRL